MKTQLNMSSVCPSRTCAECEGVRVWGCEGAGAHLQTLPIGRVPQPSRLVSTGRQDPGTLGVEGHLQQSKKKSEVTSSQPHPPHLGYFTRVTAELQQAASTCNVIDIGCGCREVECTHPVHSPSSQGQTIYFTKVSFPHLPSLLSLLLSLPLSLTHSLYYTNHPQMLSQASVQHSQRQYPALHHHDPWTRGGGRRE